MVAIGRHRRAAQQQDERNRGKREDHHQLETVDKADDSGLHLYHLVERGTSACCPAQMRGFSLVRLPAEPGAWTRGSEC